MKEQEAGTHRLARQMGRSFLGMFDQDRSLFSVSMLENESRNFYVNALTMDLWRLRFPVGRHGNEIRWGICPGHKGSLVPFFVQCRSLGRLVTFVKYYRSVRRYMFRLQ